MADNAGDKTILIVDDDRDILTALEEALGGLGAKIMTASDGDSAIAQTDKHHPDLVILDMMLPKRSGLLVMEKIGRTKKQTGRPRVIMITGNEGERHRVYAKSLGVDRYFNKPFRMEKLVEAAQELLP